MFYRINDKSFQHLICIICDEMEKGEKFRN